jgi:hypothetical protein
MVMPAMVGSLSRTLTWHPVGMPAEFVVDLSQFFVDAVS